LKGIVNDFDENAWLYAGCGIMTPARVAFHIVKGVKYYIEDSATTAFPSGKSFEVNGATAPAADLPSQNDLLACIDELQIKTAAWLSELDVNAENQAFPWAGATKLGVVLFLLCHNLYHIGELSALLNESRNGQAEDNWVKSL
jgi:hypothetical protein